jgi:hypothetical protein
MLRAVTLVSLLVTSALPVCAARTHGGTPALVGQWCTHIARPALGVLPPAGAVRGSRPRIRCAGRFAVALHALPLICAAAAQMSGIPVQRAWWCAVAVLCTLVLPVLATRSSFFPMAGRGRLCERAALEEVYDGGIPFHAG